MVTGARSGIGKAIAMALAKLGATVVMVARDRTKGESVLAEVKAASGNATSELLIADLSSQASVREAVMAFKDRHARLDLLVNNAAVFKSKRELTPDGIEVMFATNHLGPFLLTNLLLDVLKASSSARILIVTAPSTVKLNFEDVQGERRFNALSAFGATKMANLLFAFALARRLQRSGVTVNAIHPGLVKTSLMQEAPAPLRILTNLMSTTPERAVEPIVRVATAPEFADGSGRFYRNSKEIRATDYAYDESVQEQLWAESARLVDDISL
jgi:NAD(P)-dependent dehydrogenase (short-subunit alcohol dehydrogenase family)